MPTATAQPKTAGDTLVDTGRSKLTGDQSAAIGSAIGAFAPGEPAVISSVAGERNFQSNVQPKIDTANGYVTAAQQKAIDAFKESFGIKDDPLPADVQGELDDGKTEEELLYDKRLKNYDKQEKDAKSTYNSLVLSNNQAAAAQIQAVTGQWQERRGLLEQSNHSNEESWKQQFFRYGQAEYSPGMTSDMITGKEREGMRKVKELDDDYNSTVASINSATQSKNFALAANLTQTLGQIEEKALSAMEANAKEARAVNEKMRENQIKVSRQSSIASLFQQGVTDPMEILDLINYHEDGTQVGDITLDEIQDTLKIIDPTADMAGMSADLKTFKYLQKNGEIPKGWGYFDFLNASSNAKRKAATGAYVAQDAGQTYEEWYPEYLKTAPGQALAKQYGGSDNVKLSQELRKVFELQSGSVSRPDPKSNYTATTIPAKIRTEMENDSAEESVTLQQLLAAYPDVSASYVTSTFNAFHKKKAETEMTNDELIQKLEALSGSN